MLLLPLLLALFFVFLVLAFLALLALFLAVLVLAFFALLFARLFQACEEYLESGALVALKQRVFFPHYLMFFYLCKG